MNNLDYDVIKYHMTKFLDYDSLVNLSSVNNIYWKLLNNDEVWRRHYESSEKDDEIFKFDKHYYAHYIAASNENIIKCIKFDAVKLFDVIIQEVDKNTHKLFIKSLID